MTLYIVATPIGNLSDITLRALEVLKSVDLILCEDTRVTKILLHCFNINTKVESFHVKNQIEKVDYVLNLLRQGKNIALVSDAGTPGISDPGALLVSKARKEVSGIKISPIPGASALTSAFSISGLSSPDFIFFGFLPHKKGRNKILNEVIDSKRSSIFYESPHRIMKALEFLSVNLPEGRGVTVMRELTKIYEETVSGSAIEVLDFFKKNKEKVRGEFVVVVSP